MNFSGSFSVQKSLKIKSTLLDPKYQFNDSEYICLFNDNHSYIDAGFSQGIFLERKEDKISVNFLSSILETQNVIAQFKHIDKIFKSDLIEIPNLKSLIGVNLALGKDWFENSNK